MSPMRGVYHVLTTLAGPALVLWVRWRARRGKEDPTRLTERFGIASHPRPSGRLAWFHAASVGESLSILPLLRAVQAQGWQVLITTGTVTSAALLAERLPPGALHQFVPLDRIAWVRRFLDHWRPDLVLWTESELWPNTLAEIAAQKTPAVLINGRMSDRAFHGWQRRSVFARDVVSAFTMVLAQSKADGDRFTALGARDVRVSGNLKLAAPPLAADETALAALRAAIGDRPVWLAASIHPGEDTIAAHLHQALKNAHAHLLTLIVPRHPARGAEMAAMMAAAGLKVVLRSAGALPAADTDIYIADTMGELGLLFRASNLVFMGKSLAVGGGQNPVEPAQLGCAVILGPDMSNFRDLAAQLLACGAALQVADADALVEAVDRLLSDPDARQRMAAAGRTVMAPHTNAVTETMNHLAPYLRVPEIR